MPARQSAIILPACAPVRSKATPIFAACSANPVKSCLAMPDCPAAATIAAMPSAVIGIRPAMSMISLDMARNSACVSKFTTFPTSAIALSNLIAAAEASPKAPSSSPAPTTTGIMDMVSAPIRLPSPETLPSTPLSFLLMRSRGLESMSTRDMVAKTLKTSIISPLFCRG